MRSIVFSLMFVFVVGLSLLPSFAVGSTIADDCPPQVLDAITNRNNIENKRAMEIFDEMVKPSTERSVFDDCLRGISAKDSISLGLPSIESLYDQLCNFANESIDDQLNDLQGKLKYNPLPGFSVEAGGGVRQTGRGDGLEYGEDVRVRSNSEAKAREVIDTIREN